MIKKAGIILMITMLTTNTMGFASSNAIESTTTKQTSKQEVKKVLRFDKKLVKKILMEEDHYDEASAEDEISDLAKFHSELQPVLDAYLKDRAIFEGFDVEGITVKIIMERRNCDFWNALNAMDTNIENPKNAREILKYRRIDAEWNWHE